MSRATQPRVQWRYGVAADTGLSPMTRLIAAVVFSRLANGKTFELRLGAERARELTGCTPRTFAKAIRELVERGWLEVVTPWTRREPGVYRLTKLTLQSGPLGQSEMTLQSGPLGQSVSGPLGQSGVAQRATLVDAETVPLKREIDRNAGAPVGRDARPDCLSQLLDAVNAYGRHLTPNARLAGIAERFAAVGWSPARVVRVLDERGVLADTATHDGGVVIALDALADNAERDAKRYEPKAPRWSECERCSALTPLGVTVCGKCKAKADATSSRLIDEKKRPPPTSANGHRPDPVERRKAKQVRYRIDMTPTVDPYLAVASRNAARPDPCAT